MQVACSCRVKVELHMRVHIHNSLYKCHLIIPQCREVTGFLFKITLCIIFSNKDVFLIVYTFISWECIFSNLVFYQYTKDYRKAAICFKYSGLVCNEYSSDWYFLRGTFLGIIQYSRIWTKIETRINDPRIYVL